VGDVRINKLTSLSAGKGGRSRASRLGLSAARAAVVVMVVAVFLFVPPEIYVTTSACSAGCASAPNQVSFFLDIYV
jgi:hypothetical protein